MKKIRISNLIDKYGTDDEFLTYLKKTLIGKDVSFKDKNRYEHRGEVSNVDIVTANEPKRYKFLIITHKTEIGNVGHSVSVLDDIVIHNYERIMSPVDPFGEEDWDD